MAVTFQIEELKRPEQVSNYWQSIAEGIQESYAVSFRDSMAEHAHQFLLKTLSAPETVLLVATDPKNQHFAGALFVAKKQDDFVGSSAPYVYLLYTHHEYRRLGLAAKLLVKAEEILKSRGQEKLAAPAGHNDDAIISMGERRGYLREIEYMVKEL